MGTFRGLSQFKYYSLVFASGVALLEMPACKQATPPSGLDGDVSSVNKTQSTNTTDTPVTPLSIVPAVIVTNNLPSQVHFVGQNGSPPYSWSLANGSVGSVNANGDFQSYTSGGASVIVTDSKGVTATASLTAAVGGPITPNDTNYSSQVFYSQMQSPQSWAIKTDCSSVGVATIDTGADLVHPDLSTNLMPGYNTITNASGGADDSVVSHGTHVAGLIGAIGNSNVGVTGECWKAKIYPIKALDSQGSGTVTDVIEGMTKAREFGVRIINASFGGITVFDQSLYDAISNAGSAGILFIAAAGNGGSDGIGDNIDIHPEYPASYGLGNMLVVAAVNSADQLASFSNYGPISVQIAAPGVNIYSTKRSNAYGNLSGTSMAAPLITGVAAQLWAFNPSLTLAQVRAQIKSKVDSSAALSGKVETSGRVNAAKTLGYSP